MSNEHSERTLSSPKEKIKPNNGGENQYHPIAEKWTESEPKYSP